MKLFCNKRIDLIKNNRLKNELKYDYNNSKKFISHIYEYIYKYNQDIIVINFHNIYIKIYFSEGYPLIPPKLLLKNNNFYMSYIDIINNLNNNSKIIKFKTIIYDWYAHYKIYDILNDLNLNEKKIKLKHKLIYLDKIIVKYKFTDLSKKIISYFI